MTVYVALLRAVNVGGTGKLPMTTLVELCTAAGFQDTTTYIASGNAIFHSELAEHEARLALEARLEAYAGKPVGVVVRTGAEITALVAASPFGGQPGNQVVALLTDQTLPLTPLEGALGLDDERVELGARGLYIFYPQGQARTRLKLPAMQAGTARNMNTLAKIAEIAAGMERG